MLKLTSFSKVPLLLCPPAPKASSISTPNDDSTLIDFVTSTEDCCVPILVFSQPTSVPSTNSSCTFVSVDQQEDIVPMQLDLYSKAQSVINVYQLNDNRMLLIVANYGTSSTEIYLETVSRLNTTLLKHTPALVLNGLYNLTAIDQTKYLLALYNVEHAELHTVSLLQCSRNTRLMECKLDMAPIFQYHPSTIWRILFHLGTYDLCFVESESTVLTYNLRTGKLSGRGRSSKRNSFGSINTSLASLDTSPSISDVESFRST
ncbi:hypothetical protein K7432_004137 [Basidiobolus ranarum]|uniref:Uncharacterized protein n=1 Tax=Basidiobolus ranarum TaxID=34480 RepID=A0ABR2WYS3_9FUNG